MIVVFLPVERQEGNCQAIDCDHSTDQCTVKSNNQGIQPNNYRPIAQNNYQSDQRTFHSTDQNIFHSSDQRSFYHCTTQFSTNSTHSSSIMLPNSPFTLFHSSKLYKVYSQTTPSTLFSDFFLLQNIFSSLLSFKLRTPSGKLGSIVVKIVQKPLFTPCKSKKNAHVLLVNDGSLALPVPLWITAAAQIEAVWQVLSEGAVVCLHNVTFDRVKGAFYCTHTTGIHVIGPRTQNVSRLLRLFVESLGHARL